MNGMRAEQLRFDKEACARLGVELVSRPVSTTRRGIGLCSVK